jgi:hypothetical protein
MIGRFELRGALGVLQRLGVFAAAAVRGGERLVGDAVLRRRTSSCSSTRTP